MTMWAFGRQCDQTLEALMAVTARKEQVLDLVPLHSVEQLVELSKGYLQLEPLDDAPVIT